MSIIYVMIITDGSHVINIKKVLSEINVEHAKIILVNTSWSCFTLK